ncbi:MAG: hypothetical protein A2186_04310 [Candidatus Levybacteria bacterium RIFOXYA1_FULL_41_10]|nr:MAG: putative cytosol aminopeptidase [Candidatus Levybacteria bacterium GW2011_GWA1_39_32]KKR50602.1 MAG: putative cytosol aminopeptidase [Candidatus Levybacteria bacterium GW2011_GWC1_40_19]KKR73481.1 MAG: putative cytosol aminopeptidase [Candidatus Levybacteria bacterium GW2011_GWC2_40_7]KKR94683.1 MAG: putative cytosol aminopeptidase [Candidatus Levybacteria bacterium GW2011_GWA2_41_15]KKS01728.1 MAG: putative cytosol aminopeptidase [Candidatus Levybacteria bacterium GW2011_GWB1_41_21]OG
MTFEITSNPLDKISSDAVLVFVFAGEDKKSFKPLAGFKYLDKILLGLLSKTAELEKFSGKRGENLLVYSSGKTLSPRVIILGLGKKSEFVGDDLRRAVGSFSRSMKKKLDSVSLTLPTNDEISEETIVIAQLVTEGLLLGGYDFSKYKSKDDKKGRVLEAVIISAKDDDRKEIIGGVERARLYSQATILARDLVNEQSAVATPSYLADLALSIAKKDPGRIKVKILNREDAEKQGMEAFLGVARGSDTPPKFIRLEYIPEKSNKKEKLAIVGKGITFDSGGINVKPGDHMSDMKMDMSGAAIVLSVFSVISKIKPDFPVLGLIAATPNLISGKSIVPGDVVRAMNGKTIEVLNTDAEGRVTMADSLSYAVKEKATKIIDFATLTGACMVALGEEIAGLFSNNRELADQIKKAALGAGENIWELPLEKNYKELNKSSVADIANIPNMRYGGAITAALFLQEFVGNTPWAHLDIAGPAFLTKGSDISEKGGTGYGVRTVLNLL